MLRPSTRKAVLNDFDFACRLALNTLLPECSGSERTGTAPFMALELLADPGVMGELVRRYRHDLESFSWVLVWVCVCVQDGREMNPPSKPVSR